MPTKMFVEKEIIGEKGVSKDKETKHEKSEKVEKEHKDSADNTGKIEKDKSEKEHKDQKHEGKEHKTEKEHKIEGKENLLEKAHKDAELQAMPAVAEALGSQLDPQKFPDKQTGQEKPVTDTKFIFKEHKNEKLEFKEFKHEKNEVKEFKDHKIEFKEHKNEKLEFEVIPNPVFNPGGPVEQRLEALEATVTQLLHFIPENLRPDLTHGALKQEPDAAPATTKAAPSEAKPSDPKAKS